jgi:NAD(P)-dependent dehydrogenase (short-subunit alcohol dehydrogenase family)
MSRLAGKVPLITGASKGIGTATRQRIGRGRGVGRSHLRLRPEQRRSCGHGDHRLRRGRARGRYSQEENQYKRRFK